MYFIVHPLYIFTLLSNRLDEAKSALDKIFSVVENGIVLDMKLSKSEYNIFMNTEARKLHDYYDRKFRNKARLHLEYPVENVWDFTSKIDEIVLDLPNNIVVSFCGGYVEGCLPKAMSMFIKAYGTLCDENNITIRMDEDLSFCASDLRCHEGLFLSKLTKERQIYPREEFEWRLKRAS